MSSQGRIFVGSSECVRGERRGRMRKRKLELHYRIITELHYETITACVPATRIPITQRFVSHRNTTREHAKEEEEREAKTDENEILFDSFPESRVEEDITPAFVRLRLLRRFGSRFLGEP